jgi:hypothetical protein
MDEAGETGTPDSRYVHHINHTVPSRQISNYSGTILIPNPNQRTPTTLIYFKRKRSTPQAVQTTKKTNQYAVRSLIVPQIQATIIVMITPLRQPPFL